MSVDAEAWIANKIVADANNKDTIGLVPGLYFGLAYEVADRKGRLEETYPEHFFDIGWFRPERIASHRGIEISILNQKVLVFPEALEQLAGKELILQTVNVGLPTPSAKQRQVLRTVPTEQ